MFKQQKHKNVETTGYYRLYTYILIYVDIYGFFEYQRLKKLGTFFKF